MTRLAGLALLVLASTACGPTLVAQSTAPAGRVARLDQVNNFWGLQSYRMELSAGVAVALNCYRAGPCEHMDVRSDSTNVEVRKASIGTLERNPYGGHALPASGFVVIGKQPGPAKITVRTEGKSRVIAVTVIAPPQPSPPATVAR
jgi:hypothetical protein